MPQQYWLLLLGCLIAVGPIGAQKVEWVTITGAWGGLGKPAKSQITLRQEGSLYKGGGMKVERDVVQHLISAMHEPLLREPSAANLGIDEAWLQAHVEVAGKSASRLWFKDGTPSQKAYFKEKFTDVSTLQQRLNKIYKSFHTDDYPSMTIEVRFTDGTFLKTVTHSQNSLMLPWCMGESKNCGESYNAHISTTLYQVLPKNFANRARLINDDNYGGLAQAIGSEMSGSLERQWNMIGVQDKNPKALNEISKHFTVRYADINTWNDVAFNEVPNMGKPVDENLQVMLWRPGFPREFVVEVHLLRKNGVIEGVDELPKKANQYADTVLAVGWLNDFFRDHPNEHATVNYVHGVSVTDKALRIFSNDMKITGHEALVALVKASQQEAVLLVTGAGDHWIVLPDHSMILWRWSSLRPILKWPINTFSAKECTDYGVVSGGCDGTLISPEGNIVH